MLSLLTSAAGLCLTAVRVLLSLHRQQENTRINCIVDCKLGLEKNPNTL